MEHGQCRIIALFFYFYAAEDPVNHLPGVRTDRGCPGTHALLIHFRSVEFVWHIRSTGRIPVLHIVRELRMGRDPLMVKEDLDCRLGISDVDLLAAVDIRHRVPVLQQGDMAVRIDLAVQNERRYLIRDCRKRTQISPFLFQNGRTAPPSVSGTAGHCNVLRLP